MLNLAHLLPREIRQLIREGKITSPTAGMAEGYVQANLAIVPKNLAYDFLVFAQRNPKSCPVLDITDLGQAEPKLMAPGADLRYDIPKYRVYKHGEMVDEVLNLESYWQNDLVAFLLGCSFTFETALLKAGVPVRHIEEKCNVPMYVTNIDCVPSGNFHGSMVVSMRPIPQHQVVKAVQVTSRFPSVHGAPIHIGNPEAIGVFNIDKPDFGDAVPIKAGEVPVFWACGVTPQAVAMQSKPDLMITHAPGHMFICDIHDDDLAVL